MTFSQPGLPGPPPRQAAGRRRGQAVRTRLATLRIANRHRANRLFEILAHATEPVEHAVEEAAEGEAGWGQFAALGLIYAVGLGVGLLALLYLGRLWKRPARPRTISLGPGAMAVTETDLSAPAAQAAALRTGMGIAAGIGLHNFSEGLAIGQAARGGELALAGLLIVGFALHNMTEGFGIVGPWPRPGSGPPGAGSGWPGSSAAAPPSWAR